MSILARRAESEAALILENCMRFKSFEISNYQSVLSSGEVKVGDITCLVGKNEAGKTALLRALYKLNPIRTEDASYSVTDDYPRLDVGDYEDDVKAGKRPAAEVVRATFDLEKEDCYKIDKVFGPEALKSKVVMVSKGYGNAVDVALEIDEEKCMEWLCRNLAADIFRLISNQPPKKRRLRPSWCRYYNRARRSLRLPRSCQSFSMRALAPLSRAFGPRFFRLICRSFFTSTSIIK